MIAKAKIYKSMGYLFPIAVLSTFVTGFPGAIALIFYWYASLKAKKAYIEELGNELRLLEKMQYEVKTLIHLCNQKIVR